MAMGAVAALLVLAAAGVIWQFILPSSAHKTDVASLEKMAYPLPEKPSIAVLPFVNLSGDNKQEFFSDGVIEDISQATIFFLTNSNEFISVHFYNGRCLVLSINKVGAS